MPVEGTFRLAGVERPLWSVFNRAARWRVPGPSMARSALRSKGIRPAAKGWGALGGRGCAQRARSGIPARCIP